MEILVASLPTDHQMLPYQNYLQTSSPQKNLQMFQVVMRVLSVQCQHQLKTNQSTLKVTAYYGEGAGW